MTATVQAAWEFADAQIADDVCVNAFCRLRHREGHRVVTVRGVVVAHYAIGDRLGEALTMTSLVDQGHATQAEVTRAFGCCERTVRRHQRRLEDGGLSALGRPDGYPLGRSRLPQTRIDLVNSLKSRGKSNREIARMLGVSDKAIRKLLRRLGWPPQQPSEQLVLGGGGADPNLSGPDGIVAHHGPVTSPEATDRG